MTNVPQTIRDAWADVYKLFDLNFNMDGSEEAWILYWKQANELIQKYGDEVPLLEMLEEVAHLLEIFVARRKTGNSILYWGKDEHYPYPKE